MKIFALLTGLVFGLVVAVVALGSDPAQPAPALTPCGHTITSNNSLLCEFDAVIQPGYPGDDIRGGA